MLSAQTLHVAINRSCDEVYAFLSQPENFPLWAKGLANSLRREDEDWVADTPQGGSAFASARRMTSAYWIMGDAAGRRRGLRAAARSPTGAAPR